MTVGELSAQLSDYHAGCPTQALLEWDSYFGSIKLLGKPRANAANACSTRPERCSQRAIACAVEAADETADPFARSTRSLIESIILRSMMKCAGSQKA